MTILSPPYGLADSRGCGERVKPAALSRQEDRGVVASGGPPDLLIDTGVAECTDAGLGAWFEEVLLEHRRAAGVDPWCVFGHDPDRHHDALEQRVLEDHRFEGHATLLLRGEEWGETPKRVAGLLRGAGDGVALTQAPVLVPAGAVGSSGCVPEDLAEI